MFPTRVPEQIDWLRNKGYTADAPHPNPNVEPLKQLLLSHGGSAVVLHFDEPDLDSILERGSIASGNGALLILGEQSACHSNVYRLWLGDRKQITICTGYALSDDGIWRQHSWAKLGGNLFETTVNRVAYFGFDLTEEEALRFG